MSEPTTHNEAYDSTVGIQAEVVHNATVNFTRGDATPQEKYLTGLRFLEEGVPSRARHLISTAIAEGHDTTQVRFHWILALISGRGYHDLAVEELQVLRLASVRVPFYPEDECKQALRVAFGLLGMSAGEEGGAERTAERMRALPPEHSALLMKHFDLVITGSLKDSLWAQSCRQAEEIRLSGGRAGRVWFYFDPDPVGPRAAPLHPSTAPAARKKFMGQAAVLAASAIFLAATAIAAAPVVAVVFLVLAIGAFAIAVPTGYSWHMRERELKHETEKRRHRTTHDGRHRYTGDQFSDGVRDALDSFFKRDTPTGLSAGEWLERTFPMRFNLAAHIDSLYAGRGLQPEQLMWLFAHLSEGARSRYDSGEFFEPPQHRSTTPLKVLSRAALAAGCLMSLLLLVAAWQGTGAGGALLAALAAVAAFLSGRGAASAALEFKSEEIRAACEEGEQREEMAKQESAYQKYRELVSRRRPTEQEMEVWLSADKTAVLDVALRHYHLSWSDLITHLVLVTPARPYRRGRVRGGPWRYSRYTFRLFLVTQEGIREISADLDFVTGERSGEQRSNYRFDALSSVRVTEHQRSGYDLELTLTNGPVRSIRVKDADIHHLAPDEHPGEMAEIDFEATGFRHAFRLLEGIAAEGKGWIIRNDPANLPSAM